MTQGGESGTAREGARRYAAAEVTGIDRERLLQLVLDGGQRFLRLAREALVAGDVARFVERLARAQAIVAELHGTLDRQAGGEIAANLSRLYDFILVHLTEANARRSVRHLDEVLAVYGTIADAYRTVLARGAATLDG
jgi:flagellar protein FliS